MLLLSILLTLTFLFVSDNFPPHEPVISCMVGARLLGGCGTRTCYLNQTAEIYRCQYWRATNTVAGMVRHRSRERMPFSVLYIFTVQYITSYCLNISPS
uniref:Secreted protein n=1 Tax=Arundo donax TaxID=35708 RepID=A0A0A9A5L4_ARUDO